MVPKTLLSSENQTKNEKNQMNPVLLSSKLTVSGTKISDKVLNSDQDTVFPLQAALGYDIAQSLFIGKHNLLVEGPSDLLYLTWASRQLQESQEQGLDKRWIISPTGGH